MSRLVLFVWGHGFGTVHILGRIRCNPLAWSAKNTRGGVAAIASFGLIDGLRIILRALLQLLGRPPVVRGIIAIDRPHLFGIAYSNR